MQSAQVSTSNAAPPYVVALLPTSSQPASVASVTAPPLSASLPSKRHPIASQAATAPPAAAAVFVRKAESMTATGWNASTAAVVRTSDRAPPFTAEFPLNVQLLTACGFRIAPPAPFAPFAAFPRNVHPRTS